MTRPSADRLTSFPPSPTLPSHLLPSPPQPHPASSTSPPLLLHPPSSPPPPSPLPFVPPSLLHTLASRRGNVLLVSNLLLTSLRLQGPTATASLARWSRRPPRLESGRSRVRIPPATGFVRGRVIPVTQKLALQGLPCRDAWCYRVSAGTGRPGVSILRLGEAESWICKFCLSVVARTIV